MSKQLKKRIKRVVIGAAIYILAIVVNKLMGDVIVLNPDIIGTLICLACFVGAYLTIGGDVVYKALRNIVRGQLMDENFLMTLATIGAFFVGDYSEAVAVMLFYQVGECFQEYAVGKARNSIKDLMQICPDEATVIRDGEEEIVDPDEVEVGEIIVIKPGEKVPLDGVVVKGSSSLDTKALTGESMPRSVAEGEEVISGCININGVIEVKVTKEFGEATVTKILELVENASSKKGQAEQFITKFARWYTPIVVFGSIGLALIPPLAQIFVLKSAVFGFAVFKPFIYRALTFLVISCPCALVLSVPLAFFSGIGAGSKKGILFKGGVSIEALNDVKTVVMDKTGTITKGDFSVQNVISAAIYESDTLLSYAAACEVNSTHPIACSIVEEVKKRSLEIYEASSVEEISGHGIKATVKNHTVLCGNLKLMNKFNVSTEKYVNNTFGSEVIMAIDGVYAGYIVISDTIKPEAVSAIEKLKKRGTSTAMLTGDSKESADNIARMTGIDEVHAKLLPEDKLNKLAEIRKKTGAVMFVGDGINDAPVLAGADVGAAMGSGADAAIEAADVVFMKSDMESIPKAISIAKSTAFISRENVVFALAVKAIFMILGLTGHASMWMAVFADTGVAMICILNSIRVLYKKY